MLTFAILLIVAGAILRFAVDASLPGISLQKVGVILIVVGALTLVLALVFRYTDPGDQHGSGQQSHTPVPTDAVGRSALGTDSRPKCRSERV